GRAAALSRLHQPLPHAAAPDGRPPLTRRFDKCETPRPRRGVFYLFVEWAKRRQAACPPTMGRDEGWWARAPIGALGPPYGFNSRPAAPICRARRARGRVRGRA